MTEEASAMDRQTAHDVLDLRPSDAEAPRALGPGVAEPYGPAALVLSLVAIAAMAAVVAAAVVGVILLAQVATMGIDDTRSFYLSLQFDIPTKTKLSAASVTLVYVALICAVLVMAWFKARSGWRDLVALKPVGRGWRRNASIAVMVLIYAGLATLALANLRERRVPIDGPTDTLLVGLLAMNYVIFAPLAEEAVFRGWIYTGLRRRLRFGTTLFATALLFAAIHWEPRHMVLVLPLAFALGFIREQTGSIKPTIALHACYNLVIVSITLATQ